MYPFDTITVFSPASFAALQISITYSPQMVGPRFRNVPILAEEATHVATGRPHRKYARARKEMVQRLLLDGIHLHRRRMRVTQAEPFPSWHARIFDGDGRL